MEAAAATGEGLQGVYARQHVAELSFPLIGELPLALSEINQTALPLAERAFVEKFDQVSWDRHEKRKAAAARREQNAEKPPTPDEIDRAYDVVAAFERGEREEKRTGKKNEALKPSSHQRRIVRQHMAEQEGDQAPPWAENSSYVRDRLKNGYVLAEPTLVSEKYTLQPFKERWLRSPLSPVLEKFVAATAKALNRGKRDDEREVFLASDDKSKRQRQWGKLRGLDCTYVSILRSITSAFRVEIDATFVSPAVLRRCLEQAGLPCLPHIVAYSAGRHGEVIHPHLWWFLPEGSAVWFSPDERCRTAPQRKMKGVVLGVTKRLASIGADIAGAANFRDGKNPLCPKLSFAVFNETDYPDLAEWARHVDVRGDVVTEVKEALITELGLPRRMSRPLFHAAYDFCWRRLKQAYRTPTGPLTAACRYPGADRSGLADLLFEELVVAADEIQAGAATDDSKRKMLGSVADFVARAWRPGADHRNRGAAEDWVHGVDDPVERKNIGRDYANRAQVVNTVWECRRACLELISAGKKITNNAIGLLADRDPRTVATHREKIMASISLTEKDAIWCLMGGPPLQPAIIEKPSFLPENTNNAPDVPVIVVEGEQIYGCRDDVQSAHDVTSVAVRGGPGWYVVNPKAVYASDLKDCSRASASPKANNSDRQLVLSRELSMGVTAPSLVNDLATFSPTTDEVGYETYPNGRGSSSVPPSQAGAAESSSVRLSEQAVKPGHSGPQMRRRCPLGSGSRIRARRSRGRRGGLETDDPDLGSG